MTPTCGRASLPNDEWVGEDLSRDVVAQLIAVTLIGFKLGEAERHDLTLQIARDFKASPSLTDSKAGLRGAIFWH